MKMISWIFLLMLAIDINGQAPSQIAWQTAIGGTAFPAANSEVFSRIEPTSDGGFIMSSTLYSDYRISKLDGLGNIAWQVSLGGSGSDIAGSIIENSNGNFVVCGATESNDGDVSGNHGGWDYWVLEIDSTGNIIWQRCYGGSADDHAQSIIQTNEGGYLVVGKSWSINGDVSDNMGQTDYWIVKIDEFGDIQWEQSYGGSGADQATSCYSTPQGEFVIAGYSQSVDGDVTDNHSTFSDFWIIKIDMLGSIIWQKCFGGVGYEQPYAITGTNDGGYAVAGYTFNAAGDNGDVIGSNSGSSDYWIIKLNNNGDLIWQKCLGGGNWDRAYGIDVTSDGGFIVSGEYNANTTFGDATEPQSLFDCWIVKLNSFGIVEWDKIVGGTQNDSGHSVRELNPGEYICSGSTNSSDGNIIIPYYNNQYFTFKIKTNQPFVPNIEAYVNGATTNALNPLDTGFVDICLGDTIMFVATPEFPNSFENTGTGYSQDVNTNIDFAWTIGGITYSNNDTIYYVSSAGNTSLVNLLIVDQYGDSAEITSEIRIGSIPDLSGVYALDTSVCPGDGTQLFGAANITQVAANSSFYQEGLTYLPDGSGTQYATSVAVSGYTSGETIQNEADLNQVCITMEHSYLGDLEIWLQCPNGTTVPLVNSYTGGFLPGGSSGFGTYMGDPIDDSGGGGPGEGWEYCFSSVFNDINGSITINIGNTIPAPNFGNNGPSINPNNVYQPEASFNSLLGCPVNGNWTIFVQDNMGIDDGYIFGWGLDFTTAGVAGVQNTIDSSWWSPDITVIEEIGDSSIVVAPVGDGGSYTFNVLDDFGCSYDTTIFVAISDAPSCNCYVQSTFTYEGCVGDNYSIQYNGITYNESNPFGIDTLDVLNGCDSIVTIDMTFLECAPIQPIIPHMEGYVNGSTTNALNPLDIGFVDICLGDTIMFVATPEFLNSLENTGTGYSQDINTNIDLAWTIGGITYSNNDTIYYVPSAENTSLVNLLIVDQYGESAEITSEIRIGSIPDFSGVYALDTAVCPGEITQLFGAANITQIAADSSFYQEGLTYLPDGSGTQYATSVAVSGYTSGETIQNEADLNQVCITMEHSYLGDLEIWLQCPNGSTVPLVNAYPSGFLPGGTPGGGTFLGDPIDNTGGGPGEGWEYCFSSVFNDITGSITNNLGNTIPTPNFGNNGPSIDPNNVYQPESSFNSLIGCPVNGSWTLFVQDNMAQDDGYIFGWGLDFNTAGVAGVQNTIDSSWWSPDITVIEEIGDSSIVVAPVGDGGSYTFNVLDDFGCSYDTMIFVGISDAPSCNCYVESTFTYEGCVGDNYSIQYNGITYNESNPFGLDTLNSIDGCDSIITINMVFLECAPIQPINPHMEAYVNGTTINALNPLDTGFVDICLGDTIMFVATPEFPNSLENTGTGYSQDVNSNIDFAWNIEGVTFSNNDTIWYVPTVANGYLVDLIITDQNGENVEITSKIRISIPPDFSGVYAAQDIVCASEATEIYGGSNGQGSSFTIPGGSFGSSGYYGGLTHLPDGNGVQYQSPITISGFPNDAEIQSDQDLNQICITMEHSYIGDLEIWLQCPNGNIVPLVNSYSPGFLPGGTSGGGTFLGDPIDVTFPGAPGVGWEYCFSSVFNDIGPMTQNLTNTINAPTENSPSMDPNNIYEPENDFGNALAGCPVNGDWTVFVQDNIGLDDGYIFEWGLDFNANPSGVSGYQNSLDSAWWSSNPTIVQNLGDSSIIVAPDSSGSSYTFNILDDFGCSYDTTIFVGINEVSASIAADPTEGCAPLIVTFDYTNSIGDSFFLDFGDGISSYDSIPDSTSHLYGINDNFTAILYVNNEGCSDTAYVNINAGETTTYYVTDSAYCAEVYNWNGFLIYDSGTYTQAFELPNGCDSTVVLDITFIEIDFALDFSADQQYFTEPPFDVQFTNQTSNMDDYDFWWDFGDGTTMQSNNVNVFHEYTSNGTFSVTLYADDLDGDCSDTLIQSDYIFTTGQSSIHENNMVTYQIHPNPTFDLIYIQSEVPLNNTFSIFDQQGRLIRKGILEGKDTQVSLGDLSRGAYTIQVEGGFKPTVIIKN